MVENTVVLRPPRTGRTCVFGRVMGGFVERWLGIRICFSNGEYISVGDTAMFSLPTGGVCGAYAVAPLHVLHAVHRNTAMFLPPTGGVCGAYAIRPYTCYMPYIEIWTCFSNGVYISVGDTDMFSPPMGGVCGAYTVAPLHVLHAIHKNTVVFFERVTCYPSKYEHVFRTGNMFWLGIRKCFPNGVYISVRDTDMFSEPGTHDLSKYGRVFRIRRRRRRARGWRGG